MHGGFDMKKKISIKDKAGSLVRAGLPKEELFKFFDRTNRDIVDYIGLFGFFGVGQDVIWDLYEEWQII